MSIVFPFFQSLNLHLLFFRHSLKTLFIEMCKFVKLSKVGHFPPIQIIIVTLFRSGASMKLKFCLAFDFH